jgi:hypothetical protein
MKTLQLNAGDYVAYRDREIIIVQTGPMVFEVYTVDGSTYIDSFEDPCVLLESTPEGCAEYYAMHYHGLEDLADLDDYQEV